MNLRNWLAEKRAEKVPSPTTAVSAPLRGANQDYSGVNPKNDNADYTISDEVDPKKKLKEEFLDEAPLLTHIKKNDRFGFHTGRRFSRDEIAGGALGHKIAKADADHDIHYRKGTKGNQDTYFVIHKKTGHVATTISGSHNPKTKTFKIHTTDSTGKGPKAHDVYHKILKTGHASSLVGTSHSPGGQKIWQKLSSKPGVSVHGWHKNKPVNINPRDSEETHVTHDEKETLKDPATNDIHGMHLVASLHKRKTFKEHVEQIDETIAGVGAIKAKPITMMTTATPKAKNAPGSAGTMQRAADQRRIQLANLAQKQVEKQRKDRLTQVKQRKKNLKDKI